MKDQDIYLVTGAIALAAFVVYVLRSLQPRTAMAPVVPEQSPVPSVPDVRSLGIDALGWEYARRVKENVEIAKTRQVLDNVYQVAAGQFTPIASALPAEVKPHPASIVPDAAGPKP